MGLGVVPLGGQKNVDKFNKNVCTMLLFTPPEATVDLESSRS